MIHRFRAALLGGVLLPLALLVLGGPVAAAANAQVEAELNRLIAGYAASGQEGMDKLNQTQQQDLAKCVADVLGDLPDEDMQVLTTGQDLEQVMDTIGPRLAESASDQVDACFNNALAQAEPADATTTGATTTDDAATGDAAATADGSTATDDTAAADSADMGATDDAAAGAAETTDTTQTAETTPATGIDAEYMAAFEKVLRDSEPPAEAAVTEMAACMNGTLSPVMTEDEKRQAIDTSFGEEIGQQLAQAHPGEFDQFMACAEAVGAKYDQ